MTLGVAAYTFPQRIELGLLVDGDDQEDEDGEDLQEEVQAEAVASAPGDVADPQAVVEARLPADIRDRYEAYSYRNAAVILSESHPELFGELLQALRNFSLTTEMIRRAGGNESMMPKLFSQQLRPLGWHETVVQGDLLLKRIWREQIGVTNTGKAKFKKREQEFTRARYLDGHKVDYVKGRVAFDLEWNSKDQTFDRDLYAFSAFAQCGVIDVAVLVTRGETLNAVLRKLGPALKKDGTPELKSNGNPRQTIEKYGASTTWMGKLLY